MPFLESFIKFLDSFGVNVKYVLAVLGFLLGAFAFYLFGIQSSIVFEYIAGSAPLWMPIISFLLFFEFWIYYVQKEFDLSQGRTTLELKIPQEVFKSPEAMELVLTQLHQSANPDNHLQTYIDGKHPPVYGLELVSRGGDVRLYMNVPKKKFKNIAETQLYAQYPGIEVQELDIDYTAEIPWDPANYSYFSIHFGPKKADAYPIKTYIEYGLERMPKEEEKIDPMSTVLEMLGSFGPNEHAWIQLLITVNREVTFKEGALTTQEDWKADAKKEIVKIIVAANKRVGIDTEKDKTKQLTLMNLSDAEKDTIKAIERSLGKSAFNVAIRGMYIAKGKAFNPGERIGALITGWRSFDDGNRNSIGVKWRTDVNWPWWQDANETLRMAMKKRELDQYKRRAYTSQNDADKQKVMTTEELATIFHIPGKTVTTPSLARIPSKRAEPPSNLPTG